MESHLDDKSPGKGTDHSNTNGRLGQTDEFMKSPSVPITDPTLDAKRSGSIPVEAAQVLTLDNNRHGSDPIDDIKSSPLDDNHSRSGHDGKRVDNLG